MDIHFIYSYYIRGQPHRDCEVIATNTDMSIPVLVIACNLPTQQFCEVLLTTGTEIKTIVSLEDNIDVSTQI